MGAEFIEKTALLYIIKSVLENLCQNPHLLSVSYYSSGFCFLATMNLFAADCKLYKLKRKMDNVVKNS